MRNVSQTGKRGTEGRKGKERKERQGKDGSKREQVPNIVIDFPGIGLYILKFVYITKQKAL